MASSLPCMLMMCMKLRKLHINCSNLIRVVVHIVMQTDACLTDKPTAGVVSHTGKQ